MRTLKFVIFVLFFISFLILFDNELYAADTFDTSFAFVDVIREDGSIRRLPPLPDVFKNNDFYIFYNNNDYWATVFHGYSISNMYYYNTKELYISKNSDSDIIYYSKYKLSGSNWLEESKEQNVVFTSQKDMNYLTICASTFDIYKEGNIVFNKNLSSECWTDLDLSSFYSFEYNGITRYFSVPDNAVDFFIACYTYNRFTLYYTTEPAYWYVRDGRDYKDVYARNLDNTAYIPDSYFIIDYYYKCYFPSIKR